MPTAQRKPRLHPGRLEAEAYLHALPSALIALDGNGRIAYLNHAAETLLSTSQAQALGESIYSFLRCSAPLPELVQRVFADTAEISLHEQALELPGGKATVTLHITPVVAEVAVEQALLTIEKSEGMHTLAASEWKKDTTNAAGVMAAMLAHEVKNPLSGIRGAAQLLKEEVAPEHAALTDLICRETDRIRDLLAEVEVFTSGAPDLQPINIHEVLQYVLSIAGTGFARHVAIRELYDPSLPPVMGNRDLMVQMFLNLIKNAAEAMQGKDGAALTIATHYRSGYRIRPAHGSAPVSLPVMVSIEDNGPGIPDTIRKHLFEPFVTSREEGRGLGLAVVAKIASDLGIVVELDDSAPKGTRFNVMLACA